MFEPIRTGYPHSLELIASGHFLIIQLFFSFNFSTEKSKSFCYSLFLCFMRFRSIYKTEKGEISQRFKEFYSLPLFVVGPQKNLFLCMSSLTALPKIRISIGIFATETRYFIAKITLKKNDQCAFSGNEIRFVYIFIHIFL